ncbi:MAG: hydrogen gas-evolving membrane-bound hydrogenase subunit E [Thermoplasmatota archaeon]
MRKSLALLAFLVVVGFMVVGAAEMRDFGEPNTSSMDDYFIENSQDHNEVNNVVTAILFDYRGLDTLGEASILFSAVSGVVVVLRKMKEVKKGKEEEIKEEVRYP